MSIDKITRRDLKGIGVIGLADVPALGVRGMQEKFEETARRVIIPKVNEIIANCYTIGEVDRVIARKIQRLGAGDMSRAVYDPDGDGTVDMSRDSRMLAGHSADFFATRQGLEMVERTANRAIPKGQVTSIQVVTSLPRRPASGVLYLVTGE